MNERAFNRTVGRELAAARRQRGYTQQGIAESIGLSRTSVTNIEAGRQPCGLFYLALIARFLPIWDAPGFRQAVGLDDQRDLGDLRAENV